MSATAAPAPTSAGSVADALDAIGVPAWRVRVAPYPATEDDLLRIAAGPPRRSVELVDGYVVEKAMGAHEAMLGMWLGHLMLNYLDQHPTGAVFGADGYMRLFPGVVRVPDVSYIAWERGPAEGDHWDRVVDFSPDLAAEVISDSNTAKEITRKRREYLAAGTKLVWIVDPAAETVEVYSDPTQPDLMTLLKKTDVLDGGTVIPGFRLPLADLFGGCRRRAAGLKP